MPTQKLIACPENWKILAGDERSVFFSYSWDTVEHSEWVLKLAEDVSSRNHQVVVDQRLADKHVTSRMPDVAHVIATGLHCNNAVIIMSKESGWKAGVSSGPRGFLSEGVLCDELMLMRFNVYLAHKNRSLLDAPRSMLRIVTVLRSGKDCIVDYPIIDFRDDREYERSLETLLFAIECDWRVKGQFAGPMFFCLIQDGTASHGKIVDRNDPDAPHRLEGIRFHYPQI